MYLNGKKQTFCSYLQCSSVPLEKNKGTLTKILFFKEHPLPLNYSSCNTGEVLAFLCTNLKIRFMQIYRAQFYRMNSKIKTKQTRTREQDSQPKLKDLNQSSRKNLVCVL